MERKEQLEPTLEWVGFCFVANRDYTDSHMIADYRDYFRGKRITLMGLGLLGRGVGDAKFLAQCGAKLTVTDLKSAKDLSPSLKKLKGYKLKAITYVLGRHRLADFQNRDLVIKAAGVPLDSPYIAEAKKNGIPVLMSTALFVKFAKLSGVKIIGVTGTRGKTTVTRLIYEILKYYCQCQGQSLPLRKVWLGGNVLGVSTLALLPKVRSGDWAVLELDSWQLQGFGDLKISPQIAVFTNFLDDHLNYYKGDRKRYWQDKMNIFKFQQLGDHAIRGWRLKTKVPKTWKIKLLGEHNLKNIACAIKVARILNVDKKIIKKAVENFSAVGGRLELIHTWRGIRIYNDTTATSPEATLVALRALGARRRRNIVLILGGADKNLPLGELVKNLSKYCKTAILLPGTGSEGFKLKAKSLKFKEVENLKEAVEFGLAVAKRGDILLLSPAFASFGLFKNEFDRGQKFNRLVKNLK